ncbi:hypothetical protein [Micromonospora sp. NBC_01813]|uniref:hypothetical protein n=1 Tax=Micromonospora sp. NBC_01813 TaxID=2975988 RepID=UPI002DD913C5|nr:hypothetical protein [Micromonospora sp. NBC_01813]WSA10513.1 hypothetical protein OG958_06915 [Micromonospora sp. NBC_01813]
MAALGSLPAILMMVGLRNWSTLYPVFLVGLVPGTIVVFAVAGRVRRTARRELLFAIDAQGVFLGRDDLDRLPMREPWQRVDFVVYFTGRQSGDASGMTRRFVGIVRRGNIVSYRAMSGWSLNKRRATAAAVHFGSGMPVAKAPFQTVPRGSLHVLPLPREWLAANTVPSTR